MESEKIEQTDYYGKKYNRGGRALGGLVLVGLGALWLIHRMHLVFFPTWLFTWPMILIAIGIYVGARKSFSGGGWQVLLLIGGIFLIPHIYWYYTASSISGYTWPLVIIALGLYMILRPRRDFRNSDRFKAQWKNYGDKWKDSGKDWKQYYATSGGQASGATSGDDYLDETSVFGGVNRVVVSKNFKGGDIVNIFGGCDINLTQADFTGTVTIDFVQIFGGAKIIVPTDWRVIVKTTSIFGGVEDKRPPALIKENPDKTLIIDGTSMFAGISIQCY
jgi:predicted membrane protein